MGGGFSGAERASSWSAPRLAAVLLCAIGVVLFSAPASAQEEEDRWDNQLFVGGRVATSVGDWRIAQDLQVRLKDNTRSLNLYLYEAAAHWLVSPAVELVPDLRFSVYEDKVEFRPGAGILYKHLWEKRRLQQLVHQVKYQMDIEPDAGARHGLRYVAFYNLLLHERVMLNAGGGGFARFSETFTGFQFFRAFLGATFVLADTHSIGLAYFVGAENEDPTWTFIGGPMIAFNIRVSDNFVHTPAKFFSF